ncbi:MAG: MFS transporter [Pseudomonadales bacterium]
MNTGAKASWLPLIAIAGSMVMMYITSFGVNVLISSIVQDLDTTVATLQLVIVAASLIAGSLMVTAGRLGDKLGKKKIFMTGVILYTLGLVVVVLAPNTTVFTLGWGVIWPLGMVLIIPNSIALIMHFYHGPQRAMAFGIYGAVLSAVAAIAPVIVGFVANEVDWRAALAMSPVMGVLTILLAWTMAETDKDDSITIDFPSVLLSVASFGLFLITTTMAGEYGWLMQKRALMLGAMEIPTFGLSIVAYLYVLSFFLFYVFVRRGQSLKAQGQQPLLDASLLGNLPFSVGMSIAALFFLVNAAMLFAVSVFMQAGVRFDPLQTALATLPFSAVLAVVSFASPGLGKRIAPKWIVLLGALIMLLGLYLISGNLSVDMAPGDVLVGMLVAGLGAGLVMAQGTTVTMMSVTPEQSGAASGLSETMKEVVGQGFAVALAGAVLFGTVYSTMVSSYADLEGISLSDSESAEFVIELEDTFQSITEEQESVFVTTLPAATREAYGDIVAGAAQKGVRAALGVAQLVLLLCALLALLLPNQKLED